MKGLQVLLIVLAVLLAVSTTTTLTLAQGPKGTGPALAPLASASTAFTYQGQLKNGGSSVNGTCDFQFRLYDAPVAGNLTGSSPQTATTLVTNGLFAVQLDFGASPFTGDARWLDIRVACPTGGAYTPLTPRQALTAAPYALGLLPGAVITGSASTALTAISSAPQGTGIIGEADNGSNAWGVYGYSSSGIGVLASGGNNAEAPNTALNISGGRLTVGGSVRPPSSSRWSW